MWCGGGRSGATARGVACAGAPPAPLPRPGAARQAARTRSRASRRDGLEVGRADAQARVGDAEQDVGHQVAEAPRCGAVAEEAAPPLAALRALAPRPHRFRGQEQRDEQREPGPERHVATVSRADARTRRRGSAMPSRTSATRLPSTTTTLAMSAVAVTTG